MKLKHSLLTLFFTTLLLQIFASIQLDMRTDRTLFVSTDKVGVEGYKGCHKSSFQKVPAYVFTLFKKEGSKNGDCGCSQTCSWKQVGKVESNNQEVVFENMPEGEYKATVLSGEPIGCEINGDTGVFPHKSIVYRQEKSGRVVLTDPATSAVANQPFALSKHTDVLKVFPNPTSGELNIQLKNSTLTNTANIVFYDLLGREVLRKSQPIDDPKYLEWMVDINAFSEGTYLLRVFDFEGNSYEEKVLVARE